MMNPSHLPRALKNLVPESQFTFHEPVEWVDELDGNGLPTGKQVLSNFTWLDDSIPMPTKDQINAEYERVAALSSYQVPRSFEYPPMSDLADALYWQAQGDDSKMTAYLAAVDAVKQKYPKPEGV